MGLEINGTFGTNSIGKIQQPPTSSAQTTTSPIQMGSSAPTSTDSFTPSARPEGFQNECPSMPTEVAGMLADHTNNYNQAYANGNLDAADTNNGLKGKVYEFGYAVTDAFTGGPKSNFPQGSEAA